MPDIRQNNERFSRLANTDLLRGAEATRVDPGVFRATQIAAIKRTTPHMMLANCLAALLVYIVAMKSPASVVVLIWSVLMIGGSTYVFISGTKRKNRDTPHEEPIPPKSISAQAIRKANVFAGVLGALWALLPALTFNIATPELKVLIMGVVMGACGLGAFNLSRIPSAAITFAGVVAASLTGASFMLGGLEGIATALLAIIYGLALGAMILQNHSKNIRRIESEIALEEQNKIIKLLLREFESGTKDWMWETDVSGRLTYASDRLLQLAGKKSSRVIGATLFQAVGAKPKHKAWSELIRTLDAREPVELIEVPIMSNGKETWWQFNARPIHDTAGNFAGYRGVAVDITEVRSRTEELVKAKRSAERASLSKSQFLAMMSHELRTPLNSIIGYAELIVSQTRAQNTGNGHAEYAQNIADQGLHLNQLITNILDITRLERGKVQLVEQEIDLEELVEVIAKMCRIQAKTGDVGLSTRFDSPGLLVSGDLTRLKQILINLTANAIKYTPAGGAVELSVSRDKAGCPVVKVVDTGIGIEQSKIDQMFEPFTQAETNATRRYEGAGLGLAISRELARMHGGDISIISQVGEGTTAMLTLPVNRVCGSNERKSAA